MNYQDHLTIAKAIKDAQESFSPADRIAFHAAFLNVINYVGTALEGDNRDEFRRETFEHLAGITPVQDQRDRVRRVIDSTVKAGWSETYRP